MKLFFFFFGLPGWYGIAKWTFNRLNVSCPVRTDWRALFLWDPGLAVQRVLSAPKHIFFPLWSLGFSAQSPCIAKMKSGSNILCAWILSSLEWILKETSSSVRSFWRTDVETRGGWWPVAGCFTCEKSLYFITFPPAIFWILNEFWPWWEHFLGQFLIRKEGSSKILGASQNCPKLTSSPLWLRLPLEI